MTEHTITMTGKDYDSIIAQARKEALEEATEVLCYDCNRKRPVRNHPNDDTIYIHDHKDGKIRECLASEIHRLMAQEKTAPAVDGEPAGIE